MIKGTTESGFTFEIDENKINNYDFLELMVDADAGSIPAMVKAVRLILPQEEIDRIKDFVRTEDGRAPIREVYKLVSEIISYKGETKNS